MAARNAPVVVEVGRRELRVGLAGEAIPRVRRRSPLAGCATASRRSQLQWESIICEALRNAVETLGLRVAGRRVLLLGWKDLDQVTLRNAAASVLLDKLGFGELAFLDTPLAVLFAAAPTVTSSMPPSLRAAGAKAEAAGLISTPRRGDALVVDVGFEECRAVAVSHGFVVRESLVVLPCGSKSILDATAAALCRLENRVGSSASFSWDSITVQSFVRSAAFCPPLPHDGRGDGGGGRKGEDGKEDGAAEARGNGGAGSESPSRGLAVAQAAGLALSAASPGSVGLDPESTPTAAVLECLRRCPLDVRRRAASRCVIVGGAACVPGLCSRVLAECRAVAAMAAAAGRSDGGDLESR